MSELVTRVHLDDLCTKLVETFDDTQSEIVLSNRDMAEYVMFNFMEYIKVNGYNVLITKRKES